MKVGTDGVLLGAWVNTEGVSNVLDIGTGSGLVALMLAQRSPARILGIDIDEQAVGQARENMLLSPWGNRLAAQVQDVRYWKSTPEFDLIVSNPPFFTQRVYCDDALRNAARHTSDLSFGELIGAVAQLLSGQGRFAVILPAAESDTFIGLAAANGLYLSRCTWVCTKPGVRAKRVLMEFCHSVSPTDASTLLMCDETGQYTGDFIRLVGDYYL